MIGKGVYKFSRGFTAVELMVSVLIVAILATTLGVSFVKLLTIQEQEREEGYVRETLADICALYADFLSVGSSISNIVDSLSPGFVVAYRHETGGVSLETGRVSHVSQLISRENTVYENGETYKTLDLGVDVLEAGSLTRKFSRSLRGDASLLPLISARVQCRIVPLNAANMEDAALAYLKVMAQYRIRNDEGVYVTRTGTAERVVRLWNRE